MKKTLAIVLALVMILSLATTAFAATNDSITINSAKPGETYTLFKMFDLVVDNEENPTKYTYSATSEWADFVTGDGSTYLTVENGYITGINNVAEMAEKAAAYAKTKDLIGVEKVCADGANSVIFDELANGYYLITSTLGTIAMTETTPASADVTITEKNKDNTIDKTVEEKENFGDSNDAKIGDTVNFKSAINIVKGARNVVVHDKMTDGLTLDVSSIKIKDLTEGIDYTVSTSDSEWTFEITFTEDYLNDLTSDVTLELTYSAVLNENAIVVDSDGVAILDQNNQTKITYGNNTETNTDSTTTTTHKFSVYKHATGSTENLAGAVFSLKSTAGTVIKLVKIDDNNYRVANNGESGTVDTFTTVASGDIVIWGVDSENYKLTEETAPSGYNKLSADVDVTVDAGNATRVDVENKTGTELPSTGGIGTTLFYIFGGILVVGAVVLLVTKKRMSVN